MGFAFFDQSRIDPDIERVERRVFARCCLPQPGDHLIVATAGETGAGKALVAGSIADHEPVFAVVHVDADIGNAAGVGRCVLPFLAIEPEDEELSIALGWPIDRLGGVPQRVANEQLVVREGLRELFANRVATLAGARNLE